MKMGLREANQNFSKAIKFLKSGKVIVLTERGRPIATITPIVNAANKDELQALRDEGFLQGRRKNGPILTTARPVRITGNSATKALRRERDED